MLDYLDQIMCFLDASCWPDGAVKALAQLSGESVNRSRIRRCGGLSLLVQAARDNSHAMYALLQYVFDDTCTYKESLYTLA